MTYFIQCRLHRYNPSNDNACQLSEKTDEVIDSNLHMIRNARMGKYCGAMFVIFNAGHAVSKRLK